MKSWKMVMVWPLYWDVGTMISQRWKTGRKYISLKVYFKCKRRKISVYLWWIRKAWCTFIPYVDLCIPIKTPEPDRHWIWLHFWIHTSSFNFPFEKDEVINGCRNLFLFSFSLDSIVFSGRYELQNKLLAPLSNKGYIWV
jgi:hypothetical protein